MSANDVDSCTIMYFAYGDGSHHDEALFSLSSAQFHARPPNDWRYVVYTDRPSLYDGYGAEIREINAEELDRWIGSEGYIHRRETMALLDALQRYPGNVALVDTDTYFLTSPGDLFEKIGPGRAVLHVLESRLRDGRGESTEHLIDFLSRSQLIDRAGRPLPIGVDEPMWNSGVTGLNTADAAILENALDIMDTLWRATRAHHIEQFVAGLVLKNLELSEARDEVFHYWPSYVRGPFDEKLKVILAECSALPAEMRARRLYSHRPQLPTRDRCREYLKEHLRGVGLPIPGAIKSY